MEGNHFNSRPHGGRRDVRPEYNFHLDISTHALTEGDFYLVQIQPTRNISTHALTEGDTIGQIVRCRMDISTHALTEGDFFHKFTFRVHEYFNSRPHGGRPLNGHISYLVAYFNSRPHGGRPSDNDFSSFCCISTHALTEGDIIR